MAAQIPYSAGNPQAAGSDEASIKVDSTTGKLCLNIAGTQRTYSADDQSGTISGGIAVTGNSNTGFVVAKTVSFTEAGAAGTYTGSVVIPAGATLLNIQCVVTVLWGAGTSATFDCGDADDPDGWFAAINVKATDLVVGEVLDISNAENWGGKQGAYLVAATGRKGRTTAGVDSGVYYGAASTVQGVVVTVGTTSSVGRMFMTVTYAVGQVTAAVKT